MRTRLLVHLFWVGLLAGVTSAFGQPSLVSSVPANNATGVSPSAPVVLTFSEAMDSDLTYATFMDPSNPFGTVDWTETWNAAKTVLTCTPSPSWPSGKMIIWTVDGETPSGETLENAFGMFTTGSGTGGGGNGTNRWTTFQVGKSYLYNQTSTAQPVLDPELSHMFIGGVSLASNRTATAVVLKYPTGVVTNMGPSFGHPEDFMAMDFSTNQAQFEALYPAGDYEFTVQASTSNQVVKVNLPASMQQPNAPHISNFAATQTIDPTKPFTLTWDAFQGGTTKDFIHVSVGDAFDTGEWGATNGLNGTATSVTIPAGILPPGATNYTSVSFWRSVVTTNAAQVFDTIVYRQSITQIELLTTGGGTSTPLTVGKPVLQSGRMVFEAETTVGQTITLQQTSDLGLGSWQTVYTTNSPGTRVQFSVPVGNTPGAMLFRLKNGV